jgi:hypothetical protein
MSKNEGTVGGGLVALLGELVRAGLTDEMVEAVLKDPALARRAVEALAVPIAVVPAVASAAAEPHALIHGLFAPIVEQVALLKKWNIERGWGFSEEDFVVVEAEAKGIPWPENRLTAVVIVPYLDTVQRTFDELWLLAASRQERSWRWPELKSDAGHLRLLGGDGRHRRGLKVEVIDLGANRGRKPEAVRDPDTSPHAGVLAAAALHPEWVRRMNGADIPHAWLAGYECKVPGRRRWRYVPILYFRRDFRLVELGAGGCGHASDSWAAPSPGKRH